MQKKTIKLPNGKVATLTRPSTEIEIASHVDSAIRNAVQDIKASLPQEADLSAVESSLSALKQELMQVQESLKSLSEERTEPPTPEVPMEEIKAAVQDSVKDIQLPPVLGPVQNKTQYTFEVIRDKDGFIDSVKATPS